MARIAGVDIPRDKRVEHSLPYIFGIGLPTSQKILERTGINPDTRVKNLTDEEVARLRDIIEKEMRVEGDLRREVAMNVKRLRRGSRSAKLRSGKPRSMPRSRPSAHGKPWPRPPPPNKPGRRKSGLTSAPRR